MKQKEFMDKYDPNYVYSCNHKPSEEIWWVLGINSGKVFAAGHPVSIGYFEDCRNWKKERRLNHEEIAHIEKHFKMPTMKTADVPYICAGMGGGYTIGGGMLPANVPEDHVFKWHLVNYAEKPDMYQLLFRVQQAFNIWATVLPFSFDNTGNIDEADFVVRFGSLDHLKPMCPKIGDKNGHCVPLVAYPPQDFQSGRMFVDSDEWWGFDNTPETVNFVTAVAHGIGHMLCIPHIESDCGIMSAKYTGPMTELGHDESAVAIELYKEYFDKSLGGKKWWDKANEWFKPDKPVPLTQEHVEMFSLAVDGVVRIAEIMNREKKPQDGGEHADRDELVIKSNLPIPPVFGMPTGEPKTLFGKFISKLRSAEDDILVWQSQGERSDDELKAYTCHTLRLLSEWLMIED